VTVKVEETLLMTRNILVPYIEAEGSTDGNLHTFEVVNAEWVLENTTRKKPEISDAVKMAAKYFLKHRLPFQYDLTTGMLERINVIKMKCADQRFSLGFKPRKADFKRTIESKRERRLARIERREPNEDQIQIPPIHVTFPRPAQVIKVDGEIEKVSKEFSGAAIHCLEGINKQEPQGGFEDEESPFEALPQLTVGALEDDPFGFVRKLTDGEKLNNWETVEVPIIFKK